MNVFNFLDLNIWDVSTSMLAFLHSRMGLV